MILVTTEKKYAYVRLLIFNFFTSYSEEEAESVTERKSYES